MLSYKQAIEMFQKARVSKSIGTKAVKLENNTFLVQNPDKSFSVVLHQTAIVTIYQGGVYMLKTGGWNTVTTKDRLNTYGPIRISSVKGVWKLEDGRLFQDEMLIKKVA